MSTHLLSTEFMERNKSVIPEELRRVVAEGLLRKKVVPTKDFG